MSASLDRRRPRERRGLVAFLRDRRGATMVEFTLLAPVYLLMLFSIIELALISFGASTLKAGVLEAGRVVKVGGAQCFDAEDTVAAVCGGAFLPSCAERVDVESEVFASGFGGSGSASGFDGVSPGDIVMVRARYDWEIMSPIVEPFLGTDGVVPLSRSFLFRAEEFAGSACS